MMLLLFSFEEILLQVLSPKTFHISSKERSKLLLSGQWIRVVGAGFFRDRMLSGLSEVTAIRFFWLLHHNFIIYCIQILR
jgi:hypothetical protein